MADVKDTTDKKITPIIQGKKKLFADLDEAKAKPNKPKPKAAVPAAKQPVAIDDGEDAEEDDDKDDDDKAPDVWALIGQLEWKDKNEGANKTKPSQVWTHQQFTAVKTAVPQYFDALKKALDDKKFFEDHQMGSPDKFIYHIIAKGRIVYEAVLKDIIFAVAFLNEEGEFPVFLSTWR